MLDVVWASLLPAGSIAALYYADRIAQLPLGVIGIAVGTALLPLLARQLRAGADEAAMANQNRAIEVGLLFSLPASAALWILAEPIIRILFEHGRFGPDDTLRTAGALGAYAVGLPAFMLVKALTPGFFARHDTRTPLHIALVAIVLNVGLNAAFIFGTTLAQVGIALASSLSGWINALLLAAVLLSRGHWLPDPRLSERSWRMVAATIGMSAALAALLLIFRPALSRPDLTGVFALLGICALGALIYGGLGAVLGVVKLSELRFLLRRQPGVRPADPTEQP
jgi:putative peptidoglycan lipid II flippase